MLRPWWVSSCAVSVAKNPDPIVLEISGDARPPSG